MGLADLARCGSLLPGTPALTPDRTRATLPFAMNAEIIPFDLDQLRIAYKNAVDKWVDAIRAEEALATPDHSMVAMEHWDNAFFREQDARRKAAEARDAYKDALRKVNYGI
ncbi:MAG TPA: hypothetical protein VMX38_15485 [Verrucomicrobiae bacterium]|jgi:aminopeptidase N|nr:hypothetical protein [Verrucomicrobiae bacterium]